MPEWMNEFMSRWHFFVILREGNRFLLHIHRILLFFMLLFDERSLRNTLAELLERAHGFGFEILLLVS